MNVRSSVRRRPVVRPVNGAGIRGLSRLSRSCETARTNPVASSLQTPRPVDGGDEPAGARQGRRSAPQFLVHGRHAPAWALDAASARSQVPRPLEVETAWSKAGQLDWWVK